MAVANRTSTASVEVKGNQLCGGDYRYSNKARHQRSTMRKVAVKGGLNQTEMAWPSRPVGQQRARARIKELKATVVAARNFAAGIESLPPHSKKTKHT